MKTKEGIIVAATQQYWWSCGKGILWVTLLLLQEPIKHTSNLRPQGVQHARKKSDVAGVQFLEPICPGSCIIQRHIYFTKKNTSLQGISLNLLTMMCQSEKLSLFSPVLVSSSPHSFVHKVIFRNVYKQALIQVFNCKWNRHILLC